MVPHGVDPYLRPAPDAAKTALRAKLGLLVPTSSFSAGSRRSRTSATCCAASPAGAHDVDLVLAGFKRWSFESELAPIGSWGWRTG